LVVDPVMVAASGDTLLQPDAIASIRERLLRLATIITPNLREAAILVGRPVSNVQQMREAARNLVGLGVRAALVKGGHLAGDAVDVFYDGRAMREFAAPRVAVGRAHGAGCTLSAAIAAGLARGQTLEAAIAAAKSYVTRALETAPRIGHGARTLNHLVPAEPASRND
jgi:hydroxymethylpyrimidine kinase/phosphomethylpyrimidine kinase